MSDREPTPAEVVEGMQRAMNALDAIYPPTPIDADLIRDAQTFYEIALVTLLRRGCVGQPFGARWEQMTESARAIWVEAMAQWKGADETNGQPVNTTRSVALSSEQYAVVRANVGREVGYWTDTVRRAEMDRSSDLPMYQRKLAEWKSLYDKMPE